eukprot:1151718-Prymnesium_polylepis.1
MSEKCASWASPRQKLSTTTAAHETRHVHANAHVETAAACSKTKCARSDRTTATNTDRQRNQQPDGTRRLPIIRPLIVMYLVPEAPQSRVALEYRLTAHNRPLGQPATNAYLVPEAPQGA